MITPEEFPYIKSLYVNDCYTYKNFNIDLYDYKPFSHLILTGKNGSGKSTILKVINRQFLQEKTDNSAKLSARAVVATEDENGVKVNETVVSSSTTILRVEISFMRPHIINQENGKGRLMKPNEVFELHKDKVYSYFEAKRGYATQQVEGPTKESDFIAKISSADSTNYFISTFKQYLVNKKVSQAFALIDQKTEQVEETNVFFETLRIRFSQVFGVKINKFEFTNDNYEFYLHLADGRKLTFNTLSDGAYALLSILMDLFIRVDLIRKQVNNYTYNPCGIVLIDEPETHLHLQLQEQILPLLTSLFPNVQFIVATHSPAVVASIKNATVFDLTTKESRGSEETVGRSYSDLMISHFGLNNEYSETADRIINQVNEVLNTLGDKPAEMKEALQIIYDENSDYLSPTLKIELESLIIQREIQQEVTR